MAARVASSGGETAPAWLGVWVRAHCGRAWPLGPAAGEVGATPSARTIKSLRWRGWDALRLAWLSSDTGEAMPRKPQPPPPQPSRWTIYKLAAKQTWIGGVEAATEADAIEKGAKEFKQHAPKLIAVPRSGRHAGA